MSLRDTIVTAETLCELSTRPRKRRPLLSYRWSPIIPTLDQPRRRLFEHVNSRLNELAECATNERLYEQLGRGGRSMSEIRGRMRQLHVQLPPAQ